MSKLVFLKDPSVVYEANISSVGTDQISLVFKSDVPSDEVVASGFDVVNEHNGRVQGSYTAYKTIYRKGTDATVQEIQLSRDGSEWIEPAIPEIVEQPIEQSVMTLAEVIAAKKADFSRSCQVSIENGVSVDINGTFETFSYSLTGGDQTNIDDIFNTMMTTGLPQPYHCDGGPCKLYTQKQVFELYKAQKLNKLKHTTYYNQLSQILKNRYAKLEDTIENRNLVASLVYGVPEEVLYDEYKESYDQIVAGGEQLFEAMEERFNAMLEEAGVDQDE